MVDRDIMQAMQNCVNGCAKKCPYDEMSLAYEKCMSDLMKDALDLLNRQNAEIERLQKTLEDSNEADRIALEAYEQLLYENDYQRAEIKKMKVRVDAFDKAFNEVFPPEMIEKAKEMVGTNK